MKVLQIGTSYRFGGIESYLLNYASNIGNYDLKFDFLTFYDCDEIKEYHKKLTENGCSVVKVINYRKHPVKGILEIINVINNGEYDIVHYNKNSAVFLLPLIAGKLSKAKVVIAHSHNSSSDKGILKNFIHKINKHFIPLFANCYFACSEKAGEWFFSKRIRNKKEYKVIKNAIDFDKFKFDKQSRENMREEFKYSNKDIVIGNVGRFNEQKNQKFLISIFEELYKISKNYKLLLIGEGPTKKNIIEEIKGKEYANNILILSKRDDIDKIMQGLDAFVLPSLYEGLPLVGIEAQSSGLKCFFSSNITDELKITPNSIYIDAKKTSEEWARIIHSSLLKESDRNVSNYIKTSGFDIKTSILELITIYNYKLKELNKNEEKNR